ITRMPSSGPVTLTVSNPRSQWSCPPKSIPRSSPCPSGGRCPQRSCHPVSIPPSSPCPSGGRCPQRSCPPVSIPPSLRSCPPTRVRDYPDRLAQRAALGRSGVVVVGAGDFVHLLIGMPDRLEQPAGMAGCAGVVGKVTDHQGGHRDIGSTLHGVTVGVVVAPLGQPAAQGAEPGEPDRAV